MTNFLKAIWRWLRDEQQHKADHEEVLTGYSQEEIEWKVKQEDEYK